jgi:hypothetical protein
MAWRPPARLLRHEATTLILGILTAIAGNGAATATLQRMEGLHPPWLRLWLILFGFLTLCFYATYENPLPQRLSLSLKARVAVLGAVQWLFAAAVVLSFYGMATGIYRYIAGKPMAGTTFAGYALWFFVFIVLSFASRASTMVIHTRYLRGERLTDSAKQLSGGGPHHLIGFLSALPAADDEHLPEIEWSDPPSLDADLAELEAYKKRQPRPPNWSWEMLLRAVRPHRATLCELTLVCSPESLPQAPYFARRLRRYGDLRTLRINVWAEYGCERSLFPADEAIAKLHGFAFGNLDEVSSAVSDLLKYLRFARWIPQHRIMIDFTGGTKPVSVVAAAATFRGALRSQYVDTTDLVPTTYDLVTNPEVRSL